MNSSVCTYMYCRLLHHLCSNLSPAFKVSADAVPIYWLAAIHRQEFAATRPHDVALG